ncbi:MAG: helix-turn-helix domain-containing protein [Rhodospirillaceae bacterium]|nr:MAG: helix-turn-helix domain-containing protein [Rhodospirillaceae bacterium]
MFLSVSPAPQLSALVRAYWFIEDLPGDHEGSLIRTSPVPLAVLSVNMGRPNAQENGGLVPNASLLGLQSRARGWQSWSETYFVMAMLTIPGFIRLFPNVGADSADMLLDLGAIAGDAPTHSLIGAIGADQGPRRIAAMLDKWLIARLMSTSPITELRQIAVAHDILRRGESVERAARIAQVSRRQLHRMFHRHLGVGPQELAVLERLQSSLSGVQTGRGDPLHGFSDQAHQIRSWRRRLGITPGAYSRATRTPMADQFSRDGNALGPAFYL